MTKLEIELTAAIGELSNKCAKQGKYIVLLEQRLTNNGIATPRPLNKEVETQIISICAAAYNVHPEQIFIQARKRNTAMARMLVYYIFRTRFGYSLKNVGSLIGRHHASIINGVDVFKGYLSYDKEVISTYYSVMNQIENYMETISAVYKNEKLKQTLNAEI